MRKNRGFTLIELIIVIVIIGILAAIAVPKYIDLTSEAQTAALDGLAGAYSAASAINYAAHKSGNTNAQTLTDCSAAQLNTIVNEPLPAGYTVAGPAGLGDGVVGTCTLTHTDSTLSKQFTIIGTGS